MSALHAAPARRGRTFLVAEVALALVAASAPATMLTASASSTPAAAQPRAAWSANKFVGNQATFDASTGGWTAAAGQVSRTVTPAQSGTGALALANIAQSSATVSAVSGSTTASWTPATPGTRWMGWASARSATTGRAVTATVAFLDSRGQAL